MSGGEPLASRLGIFARTFRRETPEAVAAEIADAGFALAHWNFAAIGLPTLAGDVPRTTFVEIRAAFDGCGIAIPSVSLTYNVAHPDRDLRERQTRAAIELIERVPLLGADVATLCSGTREPDGIWTEHPDNAGDDAWADMRATLDRLLAAAARADIRLGIEPEAGTIVRDARHAARLLGELAPDAPIGIVLDPANLVSSATIDRQEPILREAVDLLGPRVIGLHAKETSSIDYRLVFRLLASLPPVPVIAQDVEEIDAARVRDDLLHRFGEAISSGRAGQRRLHGPVSRAASGEAGHLIERDGNREDDAARRRDTRRR